jgi:hypothetical protein
VVVMRRRPVAVYRVIDEAELLGGEAIEALDGEHGLAPPSPFRAREQRTPRRQRLGGWASTGLAVAVLVGVAAVLLSVSSHVRSPVAVPAASPPLRPTPPPRRAVVLTPPLKRRSPPRPQRRVRPAGVLHAQARRGRIVHATRAPAAVRAPTVAGWTDRPVPTARPPGAGEEFGFER